MAGSCRAAGHLRQHKGAGRKGESTRRSVVVMCPYGRAKTSTRLVGPPFGYASPCAGFEPALPAD